MDGLRRTLLPLLLALGTGIILAGVGFWLWRERPVFDSANPGSGTIIVPALYAAALFAAFYILRTATAHAIRWAAARRHQRTLRLLQAVAPHVARGVLGTALGASLTLSSATVASAWAGPSAAQQSIAASLPATTDTTASEPEPVAASEQLPSPRWSAEAINVPLARIVGGQKQPSGRAQGVRQEVVVAKGQTLWSIASQMLGRQATIAEISALWPRIYELNRAAIGADPDLLKIGTVLSLPPLK